ncbi:luciferase [Bdellovibrio bacteriovorus]|uniref:Luciferase-like monooxygenase n=1 Tax=Bdellovibrio bacteriovorus TaxID=959 RepID=A0A150WG12_BDEBC|nr:LLM class flavin-dependent oxidoreductase [Bdellovibrio bacteriovorus]KYG61932.1 luciferase [Bdellovibrio bacteriovorus]
MKKLSSTPLSVLDLAPIAEGKTIADSFRNTLDLAKHVESLGYHRFWLAEHHNLEGIASAATSVLIGYVAGGTSKIRVGSGGIMLPNHAPLVIAEQFGTLETLYPGRIDLGLGRAPGTDGFTMRALRKDFTNKDVEFSDQVQELQYFFAPAAPGQKVKAVPGAGIDVPIWLLGSSLYSAQLAAVLGLPYAFAGHFAPEMMMQAIDLYRVGFQPSKHLKAPRVMMGVQVVAADSDEKAKYLATTNYQRFLGIIRNQRVSLKPPVQDMDALWTPMEKEHVLQKLGTAVIGGPQKVQEGLQKLIDQTGADELMIMSDAFDHADRRRSFEIIKEVSV